VRVINSRGRERGVGGVSGRVAANNMTI